MTESDLKSQYERERSEFYKSSSSRAMFAPYDTWRQKKLGASSMETNGKVELTKPELTQKMKEVSPGTMMVIQREIKNNPNFISYFKTLLQDEDPAKRIFVEMQKARVNLVKPTEFRNDPATKNWGWMRRRLKPAIVNEAKSRTSGFSDYYGMSGIWDTLLDAAGKELSKESNQKSIMSFIGKAAPSNREEFRLRRADVANKAVGMGLAKHEDPSLKSKCEAVALGKVTFEEAFGIAPQVSQVSRPDVQQTIKKAEVNYQEEQAAKLSPEAAERLGVGKQRESGKKKSKKALMVGGGIAAALALLITGVVILKKN